MTGAFAVDVRRSAPVVAAACLAFVLGASAAAGHLLPAALLGAAALAVAVIVVPQAAVLVLVLAVATFLPQRFGAVSAGGIRSDIPEVLAFALLAGWGVRGLLGRNERESSFAAPLAALAAAVVLGALVGLAHGATRTAVLGPAKSYAFYLLVLPLAAAFATRDDLDRLERWVVRLAVAGSAVTLFLAAAGVAVPTGDDTVVTLDTSLAAQRLRPAVLQIVFLATLLIAARIATTGLTPRRAAALGLFIAVQGLSFNRSTWVALAVCLVLLAVLRPGERTPLRGVRLGLAGVTVAVAAYAAAATGALGPTASAMTVRLRSVASPAVVQENSLQDRLQEDAYAWQSITGSPVLGVGLGRPYGATVHSFSLARNTRVYADRSFIHNSFLGLWLGLGLAGVLAFGALAVAITRAARRAVRSLPPALGARCVAAALCVAGLALQALAQTKLYHRPSILVGAIALVLLDVPGAVSSS